MGDPPGVRAGPGFIIFPFQLIVANANADGQTTVLVRIRAVTNLGPIVGELLLSGAMRCAS